MKPEKLLIELEDVAKNLGVKVRWEKMSGSGGFCVLHETKTIVINKFLPPQSKNVILARSLGQFPMENVSLKPFVREFIEDELVLEEARQSKLKKQQAAHNSFSEMT